MTICPDWFNVNNPPEKPEEPNKKIITLETVKEVLVFDYGSLSKEEFPDDYDYVNFEVKRGNDYNTSIDDCKVLLTFVKKRMGINKKYKIERERYEQKLIEYYHRRAEWEKYKKLMDEVHQNEAKKSRRALFEELKKEFCNE
jgi:hypothetical protein